MNLMFNSKSTVMRKVVLSLLAASAAVVAGTATASAQGFTWGPKVGLNVSSMSHSGANAKAGFTAGVFGEMKTCDWFAVSAEVLYSRQGVADRWHVDGVLIKERLKSHYLNVPVLANFYVTENLALKTGVQVGFCLGATNVRKTDERTIKDPAGNIFRTADVAIPVGVSYDLGPIVLDARYNFGVTDALKGGGMKSMNNVFQLTAGLRF